MLDEKNIEIFLSLDISAYKKFMTEARRIMTSYQNEFKKLTMDNSFEQNMNDLSKVTGNLSDQQKIMVKTLDELASKREKLTDIIEQQSKAQTMENSEIEALKKELASVVKLETEYELKLAQTTNQLNEYNQVMGSAGDNGKLLTQSLKENNTALEENNIEFQNVIKGINDWENSTDGINAKLNQLNNNIDVQENTVSRLTTEYNRLNTIKDEAAREADRLRQEISAENGETAESRQRITELNRALGEQNNKKQLAENASDELRRQIIRENNEITKGKQEVNKYTNSLKDLSRQKKEIANKIKDVKKELEKENSQTTKNIDKIKELKRQLGTLENQYDAVSREIAANEAQTDKLNKKMFNTQQIMSNLASVAIYRLIGGLRDLVTATFNAGKEFESSWTSVVKTLDAPEEKLAEIRQQIIEMSKEIPATATEIAEVASIAGQLGIGADAITDFTRVMIDLGESTTMSSEEAAMSLAKFANITQMSEKDYGRLGSVIAQLGNNFATTEQDMVEMTMRLASTGEVVGLSEPQMVALATAISSVGIEAEAGKLYCPAY